MKDKELLCRVVYSVDAMAKAKGVIERHEIDALVGVAVRELSNGATEQIAFETARVSAERMILAQQSIEIMMDSIIGNFNIGTFTA